MELTEYKDSTLSKLSSFLEDESFVDTLIKNFEQQTNIKIKNQATVKKLIDKYSFTVLLDKAIAKNNNQHFKLCDKKGYEPYPTNILNIIFGIASDEGTAINFYLSDFAEHFASETYQYNDYYFEFVYGQGIAVAIYNSNKSCIFSI